MRAEVHLGGEGCRFTLRLNPPGHSEEVLEPGLVTADLEVLGGTAVAFEARCATVVGSEDLRRFRDELAGVLKTLNGVATLAHFDSKYQVTVTLKDGKGVMDVLIREWAADLSIREIGLDQTYLTGALRELDAALRVFSTVS